MFESDRSIYLASSDCRNNTHKHEDVKTQIDILTINKEALNTNKYIDKKRGKI